MAKKKSEEPNIIFRRQWESIFNRVVEKDGLEGLGLLIINIYNSLAGRNLRLMSGYLEGVFDTLIEDITHEQTEYIAICKQNAENVKKRYVTNATTVATVTTVNDGIQYNTSQYKSSQVNTSQVNISSNEDIKEESLSNDKDKKKPSPRFLPPTLDEVADYCAQKNYNIDPEKFFNYYESNGWMVGKNKMKNWRAAVSNWAKGGTSGYTHKPIKIEEPPLPPEGDIMRFFNGGGF